jgi:hypothetical protein
VLNEVDRQIRDEQRVEEDEEVWHSERV